MEKLKLTNYLNCVRCGRILKNQESKRLGMGKVCFNKHREDHLKKFKFDLGFGGENVLSREENGDCGSASSGS